LSKREEIQRRENYRSKASYPIWYRDLADGSEEGEWIRTVSRDLSGGGAAFEMPDCPPADRKPGDLLEIQLVVPPTPVFAIAEVVRIFEDNKGRLCAGVMFASINSRDRDRIVRAVLREGVKNP